MVWPKNVSLQMGCANASMTTIFIFNWRSGNGGVQISTGKNTEFDEMAITKNVGLQQGVWRRKHAETDNLHFN